MPSARRFPPPWIAEEHIESFIIRDANAPLTANAFTEGVTVTLDNIDYEAEYRAGDTPRRMRLDSRYGFCFRNCLLFFALEGLKRVHRGQYPKLHFVLESGHKNAGDADRRTATEGARPCGRI